jgi:hypothetical protein
LYGDWRKLRIGRLSAVMILATFAVVVSLLAHYFAFGIVAAYRISRALGLSVLTPDAIKYSTANWTWLVILGVLLAGLFGFFGIIRRATITDTGWDQPNPWRKIWLWVQLSLTILCLVVPLILADLVLIGERFSILNVTPAWVENFVFEAETPAVFAALLLWGWALWYVKEKLVQYVGDVAAYISAHKLNRFAEIRDRIERCAIEIGRIVYGDRRYTRIILVGHSLGSVVAYDLYNCLLREDRIDGGERRNVAERTRLLITFGSPLDKTAFLFRQQGEPGLAGVREALSAAVQPLVANFANWPQGWINIYSPADIISGAVNYYHLPAGEGAPDQRTVDNCVDYEANWPLLAHNQYWENRRLRQVLYDAICGEVFCGKAQANSEKAKAAACTK